MSQVVQAKCPHCQNVLRIPAEWVTKAMRCKHCKATFQAKANAVAASSANVATALPKAQANVPAPIAKPTPAKPSVAVAIAPPVLGMPPAPPASGDPFSFDQDEAPASDAATPRRRKKGRGTLLLVMMFFFLFLLGASAAGYVVYKAANTPLDKSNPIAKGDGKNTDALPVQPKPGPEDPPSDGSITKDTGAKNTDKDSEPTPPVTDPVPKKIIPKKVPPPKKDAAKDLVKKDGTTKAPPVSSGGEVFPRRALLISVNNYLMFNTVHYGSGQDSFRGGYPGSSTGILRDRFSRPPMNFPATQVIELSDGIPAESKAAKAHPTQKSVLETTIKDFVETSRAQDRVVVFFAGHGTSLEDKSYLIPIDGNLKNADSLIPLKWVYDQMAACKAQQKILILDLFRNSPSRGFELPGAGEGDEGTMPEAFDKDILNPPAGVQVWCSCQKEQSSVELEGGSAFAQALCHSLQGGGEMKGISTPEQPIPIEALVGSVNKRLKELVAAEKRTQVSRLTGKGSEAVVAYNKDEKLPDPMKLKPPTAAGGEAAGYAQVNNILDEIRVMPPVRETRAGDLNLLKAQNLPVFSIKRLDGYKPDGYQNITELQKRYKANADAFSKEFPLRAAYFDAVEALQESAKITMREVLPSPVDPKRKAAYRLEQEPLGMSIFKLEQALAQIRTAAEKRDMETSKRWQANFDYILARLESRLVYLFEYNYVIGRILADDLPELSPGQSGWRIGTGKKIAVTEKKAKDYAKEIKKIWERIQNQYPDTPWSLLAQRESMITLGLQWRPKSD